MQRKWFRVCVVLELFSEAESVSGSQDCSVVGVALIVARSNYFHAKWACGDENIGAVEGFDIWENCVVGQARA